MIYDLLMRLPFSCWVLACAAAQSSGLVQYVNETPISAGAAIHIALRLSTILFLLLLGIACVLRTRPSTKASGLEPRISALAGTFLIYGIALFPRCPLTPAMEVVSTFMTLIGLTGSLIALYQLGRSFSLMAESRQLVTSGPYRFVRHPLYVGEEIAALGLFIQFASVWSALIFVMQVAFQLRRIHNEEAVLSTSFPEYHAYRRTTARLVPGIY